MILEGCGVMACMLIMLAAPRKRCQPSPISSGPPAVASCEPITADLRFRDRQSPPDDIGSVTTLLERAADNYRSGEPVTGADLEDLRRRDHRDPGAGIRHGIIMDRLRDACLGDGGFRVILGMPGKSGWSMSEFRICRTQA